MQKRDGYIYLGIFFFYFIMFIVISHLNNYSKISYLHKNYFQNAVT